MTQSQSQAAREAAAIRITQDVFKIRNLENDHGKRRLRALVGVEIDTLLTLVADTQVDVLELMTGMNYLRTYPGETMLGLVWSCTEKTVRERAWHGIRALGELDYVSFV